MMIFKYPRKTSFNQNKKLEILQKKAKRVLVTGDRYWFKETVISRELEKCKSIEFVIHGGAKGADSIAGRLAVCFEIDCLCFQAYWKIYGIAAGPIRNRKMLKEGKPDFVLAFHADLENSKGTKDMVNAALKAGIPVKVVTK